MFNTLINEIMKFEIKNINKIKPFNPFEIVIKVESIREARLLFHIGNKAMLIKAIFSKDYGSGRYDQDIEGQIPGRDLSMKLEREIDKQGFEI